MKSKIQNTFLILVLIALPVCVTSAQQQGDKSIDLRPNLVVVENHVHDGGRSQIKSRQIFIYLPESGFTIDEVRAVFDTFRQKFCIPYILTIYVYSDKNMLLKKLRYEKEPVFVEFPDTDEGRQSAEKRNVSIEPKSTGYMRAEYSRYGDYEYFLYSERSESFVMTKYNLRGSESKGANQKNVCDLTTCCRN